MIVTNLVGFGMQVDASRRYNESLESLNRSLMLGKWTTFPHLEKNSLQQPTTNPETFTIFLRVLEEGTCSCFTMWQPTSQDHNGEL